MWRRFAVMTGKTLKRAALPAMVHFDRAYRGQPLPRTVRILAPGLTGLEVHRPDASTLVLKAKGTDLFECPPRAPIHICYASKTMYDFLFRGGT